MRSKNKAKRKRFDFQMYEGIQEKLYKFSSINNKSINENLNRMVSNATFADKIYFEMQYLDINERFSFKDDPDQKVYRYLSIHKDNGNFICENLTDKTDKKTRYCEFKFSEVFYKPISII